MEDEVIGTGVEETATPEQEALDSLKSTDVDISNNGEKVETKAEAKEEPKKENDEPEGLQTEITEQIKAQNDVSAELSAKGINFDDLAKEYEDTGTLSAASRAMLEKAGYGKSLVDAYINGMEATAERFADAVYKMAGGEDAFNQMAGFVRSLGDAEVSAFNKAIDDGNLTTINAMIDGYKARMTTKYGTANRSILGGNTVGGNAGGGFATKDAMIKAMNDSRYGTDPEYTSKVQQMTMRANFIG